MLGDTIRILRCERGFSPEEFAAEINISAAAVEYYEANVWTPGKQVLHKIAKLFDITDEELQSGYSVLYDETRKETLLAQNMGDNQIRVIGRIKAKEGR